MYPLAWKGNHIILTVERLETYPFAWKGNHMIPFQLVTYYIMSKVLFYQMWFNKLKNKMHETNSNFFMSISFLSLKAIKDSIYL